MMGQSLYRLGADMLDRLGVFLGRNGILGLLKRVIKWMKRILESWLRFLKMLKSKLCGEKKERQRLEED